VITVFRKLLEKELDHHKSVRNENAPGKPLVYATSKNFMDYFGLNTQMIFQRSKKY
jgi:segregation and condensation protein B